MLDYSIQTPRGRIAGVDFARLSAVLLAQERVLRPGDVALGSAAVPRRLRGAVRASTRRGARPPARLLLALPVAWIAIVGDRRGAARDASTSAPRSSRRWSPRSARPARSGMQELVRLRRERQRLVAERLAAERATDLKTRFVNHVAHELRTPLSAILGFSRLLGQEGSASNERREYAQVIVRNSTHLLRLVNNLLDDARLATGHVACRSAAGLGAPGGPRRRRDDRRPAARAKASRS